MRELLAVMLMATAMACFAAMDTTTKVLAASVPVVTVLWVRNVFQLCFVAGTGLPRRGAALMRTRAPGLQLGRALLLLGTTVCGFFGIRAMPLAQFTSIVLLTPLVLTLLFALVHREPVPPVRWLCVAGGLAGALLVLRTRAEGGAAVALLAVLIVSVNAAYQWVTSRLARMDPADTTQFYSGAVGTVLASVGMPFVWKALPATQWGMLALVAVLGMTGHLLLIRAYGIAPVARLATYLYLQLAFATLAGWIVFSHVPDAATMAGVGLIGGSGVLAALAGRRRVAALDAPRTPGSEPARAGSGLAARLDSA